MVGDVGKGLFSSFDSFYLAMILIHALCRNIILKFAFDFCFQTRTNSLSSLLISFINKVTIFLAFASLCRSAVLTAPLLALQAWSFFLSPAMQVIVTFDSVTSIATCTHRPPSQLVFTSRFSTWSPCLT